MRRIVFYEFFTIFFTSFFRKKLVKIQAFFLPPEKNNFFRDNA